MSRRMAFQEDGAFLCVPQQWHTTFKQELVAAYPETIWLNPVNRADSAWLMFNLVEHCAVWAEVTPNLSIIFGPLPGDCIDHDHEQFYRLVAPCVGDAVLTYREDDTVCRYVFSNGKVSVAEAEFVRLLWWPSAPPHYQAGHIPTRYSDSGCYGSAPPRVRHAVTMQVERGGSCW